MPRPRFLNLPPRARARLLRIATHHFAERGLDGASLNEILAEAGISKGAYYYYFDDKDDLLATVLDDAAERMLARLRLPAAETLTRETFWPALERLVDDWVKALDQPADLLRVAVQLSAAQRASPRFIAVLARAQTVYRRLIEAGQRVGCVRTDLPVDVMVRLIEALDAALDAAFLSLHGDVTAAALERHTKLMFDAIWRLLRSDAAPPAPARTPRRAARKARR